MKKIKNIIEGWRNRFRTVPPIQKELYRDRLQVCRSNECGKLKWGICTACGCPVNSKTHSLYEECPENMWHPVLQEIHGIEFVNIWELPAKVFDELVRWRRLKSKHYIPVIKDFKAISWDDWQEFKQHLHNEQQTTHTQ